MRNCQILSCQSAITLNWKSELARITPIVKRSAAMVEADGRIGEGSGEVDYVPDLWFEHQRIKAHPALAEFGRAFTESRVAV